MDHARPGHFEFLADFADAEEAERHAAKTHMAYAYVDMVVLDAQSGTLLMTLPGRKTLAGKSSLPFD